MKEIVWSSVKFFWHGGQNRILCVQRTFVKKYCSFWQNPKRFQLFSDFEENILVFWQKQSGWIVKTVFKCPGTLLEELFFEKTFFELFVYFWTSGTSFLDSWLKFFDSFVKTAFCVPNGDFWLDCFFYKNSLVFSSSSGCEGKILRFWRKNFKSLSKLQFMSIKNFCGKFDFWRKNFAIFSSTDRKFCGLLSK